MTEPEDQIRASAAAATRAQRPIGLAEVASRRPHGRRLVAVAAALVAVAVIAGVVLVAHHHQRPTALVVAPSPSSSAPSTTPTPADCLAASLVVSSTRGETLHADWLPAGYTLTQGSETELGQMGGPTYSAPGGGDVPRVELLRYHSTLPLEQLFSGAPQPTEVQGHTGIMSVATPMPEFTAFLWRPAPGVALIVNGYKLPEPDLRKIADNVQYQDGSSFNYPARPDVTVTRDEALTTLGGGGQNQAVLTSFGEISAIASSADRADVRSTLAPGVSATEPVWVAWARTPEPRAATTAVVIDAQTDRTIATIPPIGSLPLDSVTDRGAAGCVPPFGVLTRSEVTFLERPETGVTTIMKLATLGTIDKYVGSNMACGLPSTCDAAVPAWVVLQIATDHRFVDQEHGPPGRPSPTKPGSFSITILDARTGPQTTNFGGELGAGRPSAEQLAVPDLEP